MLKVIWHLIFWSCVLVAFAGGIAQALGQARLVPILGSVAVLLIGVLFLFSTVLSATTFGEAWVIGLGRITRRSHPVAYWTGLCVPFLLGLSLFGLGTYHLIQAARW